MKKNKRNLDFLTDSLIAHRGYHNITIGIPENSILAFKKAIDSQLIIELDVHILKDGKVVVFHDDNLKRMTGIEKNIKDMTYNEIKNIKLQKTNETIPLFTDVLNLVNGKVPIIVELKYDVKCGVLEKEVIKILSNYSGEYAIKSFNPFSIDYFRKNKSEVIRGQLSTDFKNKKMPILKKLILRLMLFNFITKPDFISYDINALPSNKIKKLRKNKLILGWTIRSIEDLEKAQKYCDNYICENINFENLQKTKE